MINDYIDYAYDSALKRQKRSYVHLYEKNFVTPLIWTFFVIFLGTIIVGYQILFAVATVTVLAFLHSKFYNLKPVTILFLRFFRVALPPLLLLTEYFDFKNLLLYSLAIFPIYNLKNYVEYIRTKGFNDVKPGILISVVTSSIFICFCYQNFRNLFLYTLLFSSILTIVKLVANKATSFVKTRFIKPFEILKGLGYENVEEKVKELIIFFLYLSLLGVVVWF
jgi:hypothetical protein